MYLMYIDESGDTIPLSQKGKNFFVLTGCIITEKELPKIQAMLREIKYKYYKDYDLEIKSNFLRYANPDIDIDSPIKLNSREKYNEMEADVLKFLQDIEVDVFTVVIDKKSYWDQYPSQNPYDIAYVFLLERYNSFLEEKGALGITIIDPREGQIEKHYMGNELTSIHDRMRWNDGPVWEKCPNVVEKLLFSESDKTIGIQIADLYCYPVFHIFEYGKTKDEYWRFTKGTLPKLVRSGKRLDGVGLKYFPDKTKKDQKYYS